jgi:hypothetical protein
MGRMVRSNRGGAEEAERGAVEEGRKGKWQEIGQVLSCVLRSAKRECGWRVPRQRQSDKAASCPESLRMSATVEPAANLREATEWYLEEFVTAVGK